MYVILYLSSDDIVECHGLAKTREVAEQRLKDSAKNMAEWAKDAYRAPSYSWEEIFEQIDGSNALKEIRVEVENNDFNFYMWIQSDVPVFPKQKLYAHINDGTTDCDGNRFSIGEYVEYEDCDDMEDIIDKYIDSMENCNDLTDDDIEDIRSSIKGAWIITEETLEAAECACRADMGSSLANHIAWEIIKNNAIKILEVN